MSDDISTIETMQENAEHFADVVQRVAKALCSNAPHVYDPASDDMTVEFAIQLADKDEVIDRLRTALNGSVGRLMNVKIDLATGKTKAQAAYGIEGCIKAIEAALLPKDGI